MSEQGDGGGEGDGGQTFSSDLSGMREAAASLTEQRDQSAVADEMQRGAAPAPPTEDEERDRAAEGRAAFRKQAQGTVEELLEKDGRKFNARTAAETLAALRQFEGSAAEQEARAQAAPQAEAAQQQTQPDQPAPPVNDHPAVRAQLGRLHEQERIMGEAQARYQAGLNQLLQTTHANALRDFADIQTEADIQNLATHDPARFAAFRHAAETMSATQAEIHTTLQRQAAQRQSQFEIFARQQDGEFQEKHRADIGDSVKATQAWQNTVDALRGFGFAENEITHQLSTNPAFRDARTQSLLLKLGKIHAAEQRVKLGPHRTVPSVQRPGPARDTSAAESNLEALDRKYGSGELSIKQAAEYTAARRRAK